jgi:long-chain fatty acid transport protein
MAELFRGLSCPMAALGFAAIGLAALPRPASAGGFQSEEQSVRGLGAAHSGEAADTGADVLWWNPAAIAGLDRGEVYGGVHGVLADGSARDGGSTITRPFAPTLPLGGTTASDPLTANAEPNLAFALPLNGRWSLGLAATTPFGFITDVESTSWMRYQALKLRMVDIDLQPTVAFRATDWLDLGLGLDAAYGDIHMTTALPNLSPQLSDGTSVVRGHGWNLGWIAGARLRPNERITLGVSYRSRIEHHLGGQVDTEGLLGPLAAGNGPSPSVTRFTTPWIVTIAARWRATDRWTFQAQVKRTGWSAFDTIHVDRAGAPPQGRQTTRDTTSAALGAEYAISRRWTARAGVQFDPQAIANSPILADGDRLILAVGATLQPTPRLSLDAAAAYVSYKTSSIKADATAFGGTPLATPITMIGAFSARAPIISAGARWRF